ncbi:MAG: S1 RNA-binding domain-containing protein [Anaerolineales bacterium]
MTPQSPHDTVEEAAEDTTQEAVTGEDAPATETDADVVAPESVQASTSEAETESVESQADVPVAEMSPQAETKAVESQDDALEAETEDAENQDDVPIAEISAQAEAEETKNQEDAPVAEVQLPFEPNPDIEIKPGVKLRGIVQETQLQGAIVMLETGDKGLLHISQLSDAETPIKNVTDVIDTGDEIDVWVLRHSSDTGRIDLTLLEQPALPWSAIRANEVFEGTVQRIEKYGVFLDIGAERPGLIHVSELARGYVGDPSDVVKMGDTLEAKVIGVNRRKKQIDLSVRQLEEEVATEVAASDDEEEVATAMELALRRALEESDDNPAAIQPKTSKRDKKRAKRERQDDIIRRTLRMHEDD